MPWLQWEIQDWKSPVDQGLWHTAWRLSWVCKWSMPPCSVAWVKAFLLFCWPLMLINEIPRREHDPIYKSLTGFIYDPIWKMQADSTCSNTPDYKDVRGMQHPLDRLLFFASSPWMVQLPFPFRGKSPRLDLFLSVLFLQKHKHVSHKWPHL